MSVGKIFKTLIIIVACVILGAVVLNVLLPNATSSLVTAVEGQIFNATGMSFDFNGDGVTGQSSGITNGAGASTINGAGAQVNNTGAQEEQQGAGVNGFN